MWRGGGPRHPIPTLAPHPNAGTPLPPQPFPPGPPRQTAPFEAPHVPRGCCPPPGQPGRGRGVLAMPPSPAVPCPHRGLSLLRRQRRRRGAQLELQTTPAIPRGRARPSEDISTPPSHVPRSILHPQLGLPVRSRVQLSPGALGAPAAGLRPSPATPRWMRPSCRPGRKLWSPLTFPRAI